jgi:hypothetical protein
LEQSLSLNRQSLKSLNDEIKQHAFLRHGDPDHSRDIERLIPPIVPPIPVRLPSVHNGTLFFSTSRKEIISLSDSLHLSIEQLFTTCELNYLS